METDPLSTCETSASLQRDFKASGCETLHFSFFALCAEDAELGDKQKKQTLNPHVELREFIHLYPRRGIYIHTSTNTTTNTFKVSLGRSRKVPL